MKDRIHIQQDHYYLISSQFVARHAIFSTSHYCERFLYQFNRYLGPLCELLAYRLSNEGFTFLIRTKSADAFVDYFTRKKNFQHCGFDSIELPNYIFANAMKNFLISTCLHLNKREDRSGSLFKGRFSKRKIDPNEIERTIERIEKDRVLKEHQGKWKKNVRVIWVDFWFRSHVGLKMSKKTDDFSMSLRTRLLKTRFTSLFDMHLPFLAPT